MANEKNLVPLNKRTKSERREIARKGGKASGAKRAEAKTTRDIAEMLDALSVTGKTKEALEQLGLPTEEQTQKVARLVALQKRGLQGDVAAIKLWLEIIGEAPTSTVKIETNDAVREAYEKAAAAIKGKDT